MLQPNQQNVYQAYSWYYATKEEALNWRISPGSLLVFMDPDGTCFYTKYLGYSPYSKPEFNEYPLKKLQEESTEVNHNPLPEDEMRNDISDLKEQIGRLADAITNMNQKPRYYDNKKGENKNA